MYSLHFTSCERILMNYLSSQSLFGMNVDILESNPDWRWYLLFGGGSLMLTVIVWLVFKYGQVGEDLH